VLAEVAYGLSANSLALLADAAHNLGDVLGLLLSGGAIWLSRKLPTRHRSYGYGRSTILASLVNAVVLLISVGGIGIEGIQRWLHPEAVAGHTVMIVAAVGILINGATALLFMSGRTHDLNIRGAFLHMAADAAVSFGVVVSAILIGMTGWLWLDPAASLAIAITIALSTWGLLKDSINLALDAVPEGIDPHAIDLYLRSLPGVSAVHDLHVWGLSTTATALTAHLVRQEDALDDGFLQTASAGLKERFGINHATIQVEKGDHACHLAPDDVI
jgi:cobalt-zinc-cadmium efflux system protein